MTEDPTDSGDDSDDDLEPFDDASRIAEDQFEEIYNGDDVALGNAVADAWDLIMQLPREAQANSDAVRTEAGAVVLRYPVPGHQHSIFWSTAGPRIEAIFPYP